MSGSPIKADDLFAAWGRQQWKSIYLFAGSEEFLIDQALRQATAQWVPDDLDGLRKERLDFSQDSVEAFSEACRTPPFLGGHKVIRVDHATALSAADQEIAADILAKLSPDVRVLMLWGKEWRQRDDLKKHLVQAALEGGHVVVFWPLYPDQARRWAMSRIRQYRKSLSEEAASWLVEQQGENLQTLDQELIKCSLYVGDRPDIELEDVQASAGYEKASSPFDWLSAIRRKQIQEAARVLECLLDEGEEPVRLLALVSRTLRDWLSTKNSGENASLLAMRFHIRRGEENLFVRELGRWSEAELVAGIGDCVNAEQSIKSGKEQPDMALTLLTLRLGGLQAADALR